MRASTRKEESWKIEPLHLIALRMLEKRTSLTDKELFQALKSSHAALGGDDLTKTLMRMETTGLITVSSLPKGKRLVQLVEGYRASGYDANKKRR